MGLLKENGARTWPTVRHNLVEIHRLIEMGKFKMQELSRNTPESLAKQYCKLIQFLVWLLRSGQMGNKSRATVYIGWSQVMANAGYIDYIPGSLSWSHPYRFLGVSLVLGFCLKPKCPLSSLLFSVLSLPTPHTIFYVPIPTFPRRPKKSISSYQRDPSVTPCYLTSLGLWIAAWLSFPLQLISTFIVLTYHVCLSGSGLSHSGFFF